MIGQQSNTFRRDGTLGNWNVVFRMEMGHDKSSTEFLGADSHKEKYTLYYTILGFH